MSTFQRNAMLRMSGILGTPYPDLVRRLQSPGKRSRAIRCVRSLREKGLIRHSVENGGYIVTDTGKKALQS